MLKQLLHQVCIWCKVTLTTITGSRCLEHKRIVRVVFPWKLLSKCCNKVKMCLLKNYLTRKIIVTKIALFHKIQKKAMIGLKKEG